jgi:hypothetical protein
MKKYNELEIELVLLQAQDVVKTSLGFGGVEDNGGFENPNPVGDF